MHYSKMLKQLITLKKNLSNGTLGKLNNKGVVAVVARGNDRVFLGVSSVVFHDISNAKIVEALAMWEALSLADNMLIWRARLAIASK